MKIIKYGLNALLLSLILTFSSTVMAQEVNINTADAQTIADSLNGIGLKKAQAIIAWRTEHGNFKDLSGLENVKGIGQKTLEKNKDNIQF
ncbi:MAG: ComEA family DNA-binding protein [gamma proteobacterium symbiont of Bathyaustriella thionipta]|nr:ComEA family DNA-binding protein [gamma proteobacterium symbiont of Bathyaustriella thionipta]MCU7948667.1 ComEA family DNA-binding protein [gamma proteobacterium symbiont of Bathyaustriella thionipta]MCU7952627.1 ComEA family DNA-binding protein [gamma proteobacterium symbiont of Bathyaustriella thionipta]MCU7955124.1 ComEA family DNA-binding protein [gamma proteobacterium symbiont of Bathyaustriella thionipta]MCU7967178.1 ComEA family DNA-binding protein [gamma proteobacterium symbiont of 